MTTTRIKGHERKLIEIMERNGCHGPFDIDYERRVIKTHIGWFTFKRVLEAPEEQIKSLIEQMHVRKYGTPPDSVQGRRIAKIRRQREAARASEVQG